jgi:hypothetical protein
VWKQAPVNALYDRIIHEIDHGNITHIVSANYGISLDSEVLPIAEKFRKISTRANWQHLQHISEFDRYRWEILQHQWLVAGRDWNICVHNRPIGLRNLSRQPGLKVLVRPDLIMTEDLVPLTAAQLNSTELRFCPCDHNEWQLIN